VLDWRSFALVPRIPPDGFFMPRSDLDALRRCVGCFAFLALFLAAERVATADGTPENPHWIWSAKGETPVRVFTKSIELDDAVLSAGLKLAADSCRAEVAINGTAALTLEPYSPTQELDVTRWMRRGKNDFVVTATPVETAPVAVAFSFTISTKNGGRRSIVSDPSWELAAPRAGTSGRAKPTAISLGLVRPEIWGIGRRPAITSPFENYEQWKETQIGAARKDRKPKFYTAPGFEIALVRKALPDEGSWISMAFDPQGRLTVSREDRGLLQMTLAEDRKSVLKVEPVKLEVDEVRGMLYADGLLYLNANNSQTLFTAKLGADGTLSDLTVVRKFPGKVGHGRNDLALGLDGAIYSMHGDSVEQPQESILDRTSPLRESRKSATAGKPMRREGHLVRLNSDRKSWELICSGLRNPYGVAVNRFGDVFTYDADNEFDMGTPWYRPTRIVQLVSGADYGYRDAGGSWPVEVPDHPDVGVPLIDVGRGSPTSAMFGDKLAFPSPYRDALYVLDWSYGRVLAVHLEPRGAGYRAALELFLQGQPLNVTDLAAGPDGAMYLITGGRKTESALYRVAFTGPKEELQKTAVPKADEPHRQDLETFAEMQRTKRRDIESRYGSAEQDQWEPVFNGGPDPMLRQAVRTLMERQWSASRGESIASDLVVRGSPSLSELEAAMLLVRGEATAQIPKVLAYFTSFELSEAEVGAALTAVYVIEQCRTLDPTTFAKWRKRVADHLLASADHRSDGLVVSPWGDNLVLRRRLAKLLGEIDEPDIAQPFIEKIGVPLLNSSVQEDRWAGLLALRNQREGWTIETRRLYYTTLQDASRFVGGQGLTTFIDRLRKDSTATLTDAEKSALGAVIDAPKFVDEPLPPARPHVKKWKLADLATLYVENSDRSAEQAGDSKRGAEVFRAALCNRCHRSGLNGPAVGPDLTVVARRFSRRDMLDSIVTPSHAVAEQYRNAQVIGEDGRVHTGRIVSEGDFRSPKLKINTDPLRPSQVIELDKQEIAEYRLLETSPMPEGLLDTLKLSEIADLLAFLESGGQ